MNRISNWFWNETFWFPDGVSFNDTKPDGDVFYAQPRDLFVLPVYVFTASIFRNLYERHVFYPIAAKLLKIDLKALTKKEKVYGPDSNDARRKHLKLQKISNTLFKIAETSWRNLYSLFSTMLGFYILLQASWFWDGRHCWIGFPKHPLSLSLYCYYMMEGAFYISVLLHIATDLQRKDGSIMVIHHVAAVTLIVFSYATNETRVGSLTLLLHRLADVVLHLAKLLLYCNREKLANYVFIVFAFTFLFTRLYIYPFYLLHTLIVKLTWYFKPYPWHYIRSAFVVTLLILHILWSYMILKMVAKIFTKGPIDRDERSDTEDEGTDNEETRKKKN